MFTEKDLLKLLLKRAPKKTAEEDYQGIYRKYGGAKTNLEDYLKHYFRRSFIDKIEVWKLIENIKRKINTADFNADPEKVVDDFIDKYKEENQAEDYLQDAVWKKAEAAPLFLTDEEEIKRVFFSNDSMSKDDQEILKQYEAELLKITASLILTRLDSYRQTWQKDKKRKKIPERQTENTPEPLTVTIHESVESAKKKQDWKKGLLEGVAAHIKEISKDESRYRANMLIFDKQLLGLSKSDDDKIDKKIKSFKEEIAATDDAEYTAGLEEYIEELERSKSLRAWTDKTVANSLGLTSDSDRKSIGNWNKALVSEIRDFLEGKPELREEIEKHPKVEVPPYNKVLSDAANSKEFKRYIDKQHAEGSLRPKWPTEKGEEEESDTRTLKDISKPHKIINLLIEGKKRSQIIKDLKIKEDSDVDMVLLRYFKPWYEKWYRANHEEIKKACIRIRRALMYIKAVATSIATTEMSKENLPYARVSAKKEKALPGETLKEKLAPVLKEKKKKQKTVETTPQGLLDAEKKVLQEKWRDEPDEGKRKKLEDQIDKVEKKEKDLEPSGPKDIDEWYLKEVEKALKIRRGIKALIYYSSPYKVKIGEKERTGVNIKDPSKEVSLEEAQKEFKWVKYEVELNIQRTWKNTQKTIEYEYSQKVTPDGDFTGPGKSILKIDSKKVNDSEELKKKVDSFVEDEMLPEGLSPLMLSVGRKENLDRPKNVLFGSKYFNTLSPGEKPILGTDSFIRQFEGIYKVDPAEKARVKEVDRIKTKVILPSQKKNLERKLKNYKTELTKERDPEKKKKLQDLIDKNEKYLAGKLDTEDIQKLDESNKEWLEYRSGQAMIEHLDEEFRHIPELSYDQVKKLNDTLTIQLKKLPAVTSIEYMETILENLTGNIIDRFKGRSKNTKRDLEKEKADLLKLQEPDFTTRKETPDYKEKNAPQIDRFEKQIKIHEDFIENDEKFAEEIEEITGKFRAKMEEMEKSDATKKAYYLPRNLISLADHIRNFCKSAGVFKTRGEIVKEITKKKSELDNMKERLQNQEIDLRKMTKSIDPSMEETYEEGKGVESPEKKDEKERKPVQERQRILQDRIDKLKKKIEKFEGDVKGLEGKHESFEVPEFPETSSKKVEDLLSIFEDLGISKLRKTRVTGYMDTTDFLQLAHSVQSALRKERDERIKKYEKDNKDKAGREKYLKELEGIRGDKLEKIHSLIGELPGDVKKRLEKFKTEVLKDKESGQESFDEWLKNRNIDWDPKTIAGKMEGLLKELKEQEGAPKKQRGVNVIPAPVAKITRQNLNSTKNSLGHFMDMFNAESLKQVKLPEAEEGRLNKALDKLKTEYSSLQKGMAEIVKIEAEKGTEGINVKEMLNTALSDIGKIRGAFLSAEKVPAVVYAESFQKIIKDFSETYNYLASTLDFGKAAAPTSVYAVEGKPYDPDKEEKKERKQLTIEEAAAKAEGTRRDIEKEMEEIQTAPIDAVDQIQYSVKRLNTLFKKLVGFYRGIRPEKEYGRSASYEDYRKLSCIPYNTEVPYKAAFPYAKVAGKIPYVFPDNVSHEYTVANQLVAQIKKMFPEELKKQKINLGNEAELQLKHIKNDILSAYDEEDELEALAAKKGIGFDDAKADVKLIKDATAKAAFSGFILKWNEIVRNVLYSMPFRVDEKNPLETSFKSKDYPNMGAYVMKMLPKLFKQEIPEKIWTDPAFKLDEDEVKRRKKITDFIEEAFGKQTIEFDKPDKGDKKKRQEEFGEQGKGIDEIKEKMKGKIQRLKEIKNILNPPEKKEPVEEPVEKSAHIPYGIVAAAPSKKKLKEEQADLEKEIQEAQKEIDTLSEKKKDVVKAPLKQEKPKEEKSDAVKKIEDQIEDIKVQISGKKGPEAEKGQNRIMKLQRDIDDFKGAAKGEKEKGEKNKLYEGFKEHAKEEFALSGPAKGKGGKNREKLIKPNPPDNTLEAMKDDLKRLFKKYRKDPKQLVAEWLKLFSGAVMKGLTNPGENEYIDPNDVTLALVGWVKKMKNFFPMLSAGMIGKSFFTGLRSPGVKFSEEGRFKRDPKPYKKIKKDIGAVDIEINNLKEAEEFETLVEKIFKELNFYVKPDSVLPPNSLQNLRRIPQYMPAEFYDAVDSFKGDKDDRPRPPGEVKPKKVDPDEAEKQKIRDLREKNPDKKYVDPDDPKAWADFKKQKGTPPKTVPPEERERQKKQLKREQESVKQFSPAEKRKMLEEKSKQRGQRSSTQSLAFQLAQKFAFSDIQSIDTQTEEDLINIT